MMALNLISLAAAAVNHAEMDCTVVVSDYDNADNIVHGMLPMLKGTPCKMHVIAKADAGCTTLDKMLSEERKKKSKTIGDNEVYCKDSPNVGTEVGTEAHFVADNYEILPALLLFVPSSTGRPARRVLLRKWMEEIRANKINAGFECHTARHGKNVEAEISWGIHKWKDHELYPAEPHGLGAWLHEHTDSDVGAIQRTPICWNGVFKTSRQLLLQRPLQLYKNLTQELEKAAFPECGHYVEHSIGVLFSGKQDWTLKQHTTSDQFTIGDVITAETEIAAQEKDEDGSEIPDSFASYLMAVELAAHEPHDHWRSGATASASRPSNTSAVAEVPLRSTREEAAVQAKLPVAVRNESGVAHFHSAHTAGSKSAGNQRALREGA